MGNLKQGFAGESFDEVLVFSGFQAGYKVSWDLIENGHKLGYSGPGDAEMVTSGSLCSLRVFY
ncbi:MAG: hypothetical protein Q7K98_07230 [Candidatus Omnitrophota bacterium]|nr:hypothetical protein [Candidatus Omnitrophota bacterium]